MSALSVAINFIMHMDTELEQLAQQYHQLIYALLFTVIFCESAFIITPFLPGDSLLFAAGSIAALAYLNIYLLILLLLIAAVIGGSINYTIGRWFGTWLCKHTSLVKPKRIEEAKQFFDKYGANAVIIARFIPIIRSFIPFVVGLVNMSHKKFVVYNIIGALLWILLLTCLGYFFGNIPTVKAHFGLVIIAIIVISFIPVAYSFLIKHWHLVDVRKVKNPKE